MNDYPGFVYNEEERTVSIENGDTSVKIYSDVDYEEFKLIDKVDKFVTETTGLQDVLFEMTIYQDELSSNGSYFDYLNQLQQKTAKAYRQCTEYQEILSESDSEVLIDQLPILYKLEKFLKHFFRALTISQSLAFSQRLCMEYTATKDYLYLYSLIRNVCSTIEYLGSLIENRIGKGKIDLDDKSITAVDAYEEIKKQNLDDVFNSDQTVHLPPNNQEIKMEEIGLSTGSIKYLWSKRCDIVHECPLIVSQEDIEHLPDDIVNTCVITESDIQKLTWLSFRLHYHSVSIFLNYVLSYLRKMLEGFVETLYNKSSTLSG